MGLGQGTTRDEDKYLGMYHHKNLPFLCFFSPIYFSYHFLCICVCVCVCVCVLKCFPNIFSFKFPTVGHVETNYVCECTKTDRSLRKSFKETTTKKRKCVLQSCPCLLQMFSWRFWNMSMSRVFIYCTSTFVYSAGKDYRNSRLRSQCMRSDDSTSRSISLNAYNTKMRLQ